MTRWLLAAALALIGWPALAGAPMIWLGYHQTRDFMEPYLAPDQWAKSSRAIKMVQLPVALTSRMDDADLRRMFKFLLARGIGFGLEAPILTPGAGGCGRGVEGYAQAGVVSDLAARISRLGGRLDEITMDEPLYFGHVAAAFWRPNDGVCRADVADVAADAAQVIGAVRAVFPRVIVGDVEPVGGAGTGVDTRDLQAWLTAFQNAAGGRLEFLHFDVVWQDGAPANWVAPLAAAWRAARHDGIRTGVIYDGDPGDATNLAWTANAAARYRTIERTLRMAPDDAVFETWMAHPDALVPEDTPGTMTNLVLGYVEWRNGVCKSCG